MDQKLLLEYRSLFSSTQKHPNVIRLSVRMRDMVDEAPVRNAVTKTMERYPYFRVKLEVRDDGLYFAENDAEVPVFHTKEIMSLSDARSNYHLISFTYWNNWIHMDISHSLTDGTGAYEVMRTFLYYYCEERYHIHLSGDQIRLIGDEITPEEWMDPVAERQDFPEPARVSMTPCFQLDKDGNETCTEDPIAYSIHIPEKEFMRFNIENDGSPATMISLLLSRAIDRLYPERDKPIRIILCNNQRPALKAPKAHQSLVGGIFLEYSDKIRGWPLERQGTAFRGTVFAQSMDEKVLAGVSNMVGMCRYMKAMQTDEERIAFSQNVNRMAYTIASATVSYVGKANFQSSERYIRDMRLQTSQSGILLIEVSAVNGIFELEWMQQIASDRLIRMFLKELEENDITYDLVDAGQVRLPALMYPWVK